MKVLLHICCAPCSISCIDKLRSDGIDVVGYWYNPNIHPFIEYKTRKETLETYSKMIDLDVIYNDYYGLREFCKNVINNVDNRCGYCYYCRLSEVAKEAKKLGFEYFSTTLLISPYQNHELLKKTGEEVAKKYGIKFYYEDFRPYFKDSYAKARELGLYTQKYCGCIFSEEDRYKNSQKIANKPNDKTKFCIKKINSKSEYLPFISDKKDLIDNNVDVYGLMADEKLVSLVFISKLDNDMVELKYVTTLREFRNKGYAKKILKLIPYNYKQKYKKMIVGSPREYLSLFIKQGFDTYVEKNISDDFIYYSNSLDGK